MDSPPQDGTAHDFDADDRRSQLQRFSGAASLLAALFREHNQQWWASEYRRVADAAQWLLSGEGSHDDLRWVASELPKGPVWIDARVAHYYGLRREAWHGEVGRWQAEAERVALELRSRGVREAP